MRRFVSAEFSLSGGLRSRRKQKEEKSSLKGKGRVEAVKRLGEKIPLLQTASRSKSAGSSDRPSSQAASPTILITLTVILGHTGFC